MNSSPHTREKGNAAEGIAAEFLTSKGYKIKKRNFHFGRIGEIDIIAEENDVLVFVEVKSKYSSKYGDPLESITYSKQKKIRKTAEGYIYVNKQYGRECRFDVITVDYSNNKENPKVQHLINAM